jgi:hypothetical protein
MGNRRHTSHRDFLVTTATAATGAMIVGLGNKGGAMGHRWRSHRDS